MQLNALRWGVFNVFNGTVIGEIAVTMMVGIASAALETQTGMTIVGVKRDGVKNSAKRKKLMPRSPLVSLVLRLEP
ncbi:hypothetical protein C5750_10490 [Phyllobacterium myrsinacearum]|uniref:Uncharacterized protein n=1 Tax=Phyllobacterium myrsinacearum TaxID=28101 RepID=A0A2S9JQU4_9HYPH|nr:hypothetical protein C5750_10490 [Phyllobacterium myrsinacearum]